MIEMELGKNAKLLCKSCQFKLKRFLSLLSLLKIPAPQLTSNKKIVVFSVFLETVILISWWPDSLGLKSRPRNLGPRPVMCSWASHFTLTETFSSTIKDQSYLAKSWGEGVRRTSLTLKGSVKSDCLFIQIGVSSLQTGKKLVSLPNFFSQPFQIRQTDHPSHINYDILKTNNFR